MPWPAEVTLRIPPPLDTPLTIEGTRLMAGEKLVAEAAPAVIDLQPPLPVSFEDAVTASRSYPWFSKHPYPSCFVCGPEHPEGLHIFPGRAGDVAAAPWMPAEEVSAEVMWAALDCPSWFGWQCVHGWNEGPMLLGRLAARIDSLPRAGERCVALGWPLVREGRKIHTGSAVYGEDGKLKAVGRSTWIVVKPVT